MLGFDLRPKFTSGRGGGGSGEPWEPQPGEGAGFGGACPSPRAFGRTWGVKGSVSGSKARSETWGNNNNNNKKRISWAGMERPSPGTAPSRTGSVPAPVPGENS